MWHLTATAVETMARLDRSCRACHRWIDKGKPHSVAVRKVTCSGGSVLVPYRFHHECAPADARRVAA